MSSLLTANLLSLVSACFTAASSWTKDPHRTYWYQVGQCLVYAAAAYFFGTYATIIMMLFNAFRNGLVAAQKYSLQWMIFCSIFSLAAGLVFNGHSLAEYISVIMGVYYTVSSFFLKEAKAVKINLAVDLAMWFVYDLLVFDVPSGIMDLTSVILALITVGRIRRSEARSRLLKAEEEQSR